MIDGSHNEYFGQKPYGGQYSYFKHIKADVQYLKTYLVNSVQVRVSIIVKAVLYVTVAILL